MTTGTAQAATWPVQGENDPSTFDCDHLYYSNFRSGMQFRAGASGDAEIQNTVISKRVGTGLPDYWSTNMALGKDPDTGRVAAFYSSYTTGNLTLYKHVSGTNTVTDEIAGGESRKLPSGVNWGGLGADPASGRLYGAQNGGAPVLFSMNLASGATKTFSRGSTLKPVPANDPVFAGGSLVPDLFVDSSGGVYYGIVYGGQSYIYRFDPDTGETTQAVKVTGPGSSNGFNNYGMAFLNGSIYLGYYGGALYKVDPRTGVSRQVPGGNAHTNQVGRITSESGGTWPITDLASCSIAPDLTKRLVVTKKADKTDAKPGEKVTYTVTVANEGMATAPGTAVTDDLSGVVDDAAYNDDAKAVSGGAELAKPRYDAAGKRLTWTGDLGAGAIVTITYSVTIGSPPGGDKKLDNVVTVPDSNCAEGGKDPDCAARVDVATLKIVKTSAPKKPMPGQKVTYTVKLTNDGTADWADATVVDDLSDVVDDAAYNSDATATSGVVNYSGTDKTLRWAGTVGKGATVTITYSVTVGNPPGGNKRLTNVVVGPDGSTCPEGSTDPDCGTDEPVNGVVITKSAAPDSAKPGDVVTYTLTARTLDGSAATGVTLTDDLSGVIDDATYNGDAVATADGVPTPAQPGYDSPTLTWTGDIPAGKTVTITYSVKVGTPPAGDKVLRNAVTGPDGSTCPPGSTDPACGTVTPIGALEIKKTASPASAMPGDKVTYTVKVKNVGSAAYPGASFTDDLSGVLDDATWNGDASATAGATTFDEQGRKLTWTGDVAAGGEVTVTYSVTIGKPPAGDKRLTNVVVGPDGSTCPPGGSDPDCATETPIGALVLAKTAAPASAKPGDVVTYTVTASNPGTGVYRDARFTDDLSGALDDATYNQDARATAGTVTYTEPKLTWTADLPAGATVTITYSVKVGTPPAGDKVLRNAVTGPDGSTCPPGSTDPACGTVTPIGALEIKKTVSPASAMPGEKVTYTVKVTNTGSAAYPGATFTDYLSGVLDDARWNGDASATAGATTFDEPGRKLSWTGDVAEGSTVTVTYSVTVGKPPAGDKRLTNVVVGPEGSTCPPGSTDPDCSAVTSVGVLVLAKTAAPESVKPGEVVTYTVTASNPGTGVYRGARFSDDLSGVLDDATYNQDARATAGTVMYAAPNLTWEADLPAGVTVTVTYSVTVNKPPAGDRTLRNAVTGTDDSTCPPGSTEPDCSAVTPVGVLVLAKTAAPESVKPGDVVTYTVTASNPGSGVYRDARFTDDLSGVLDDAVYNQDARATTGTVTYTEPRLTWEADLPAGATVTITYSVTVNKPPTGDRTLRNAVTGTEDSTCPPGSTDPDCSTVTPVAALRIVKTAAPAAPRAGDRVTYTVRVQNTGTAAYPGARVSDDLTGVLDDATYNDDATATGGTTGYEAPVVTWTGDVAAGATVTITYSVTVNRPPGGDKKLSNVVTGTPDGNCPPGSADPDCGTVTPVPSLKIRKTATPDEVKTGDTVSYTVTVENVGAATDPAASFTDDLTGVLDDATYTGDAKADSGSVTVSVAPPTLTWTGSLAPGAKATVTYSVVVTNKGDKRLVNVVTGAGSNCDEGSEDPDCRNELPTPALRITKTAAPAVAAPGGKVTYTVVVRNTGQAPYPGASFADDLTKVLDDATYNGDAVADIGTVGYSTPKLTWTGTVAPGATATVTYSVTVAKPLRGDHFLDNAVTGDEGTNCPPSGQRDPACSTRTPVLSMVIAKSASPSSVTPGGKVTYTLSIANTGTGAYDDAAVTDDLTGVLSGATYNGDAKATSGSVALSGKLLRWHGKLAVGQKVVVTYSVTAGAGEGKLRNAVTSTTPGANCLTPAEPGCSTETPVTPGEPPVDPNPPVGPPVDPPGPLASTGSHISDLLALAFAALLAGAWMLWFARRRVRR